MGRFYGKHIPDEFISDWTDKKYENEPEHWHWYMLGHEDGYNEAVFYQSKEIDEHLRRENLRLKGELTTLSKTKEDMREEFDFIDKICKQYDKENQAPRIEG